jgi:multicomponent Na+:H+ antiporter subunit G
MLILTGLFTLITAPVIAHRVGQLAYREQNLRDSLTIDEMAPESPRYTEREQDSGHGTD